MVSYSFADCKNEEKKKEQNFVLRVPPVPNMEQLLEFQFIGPEYELPNYEITQEETIELQELMSQNNDSLISDTQSGISSTPKKKEKHVTISPQDLIINNSNTVELDIDAPVIFSPDRSAVTQENITPNPSHSSFENDIRTYNNFPFPTVENPNLNVPLEKQSSFEEELFSICFSNRDDILQEFNLENSSLELQNHNNETQENAEPIDKVESEETMANPQTSNDEPKTSPRKRGRKPFERSIDTLNEFEQYFYDTPFWGERVGPRNNQGFNGDQLVFEIAVVLYFLPIGNYYTVNEITLMLKGKFGSTLCNKSINVDRVSTAMRNYMKFLHGGRGNLKYAFSRGEQLTPRRKTYCYRGELNEAYYKWAREFTPN